MRTLQEYTEVLWKRVQDLSIVEPKKGEGVLFIAIDVPESVDVTTLVAVKHARNVVVGLRVEDMSELNVDNVYRVLLTVAHSLLNYVIQLAKYKLSLDDKLIIALKNNMIHLIVTEVLLEDDIVL